MNTTIAYLDFFSNHLDLIIEYELTLITVDLISNLLRCILCYHKSCWILIVFKTTMSFVTRAPRLEISHFVFYTIHPVFSFHLNVFQCQSQSESASAFRQGTIHNTPIKMSHRNFEVGTFCPEEKNLLNLFPKKEIRFIFLDNKINL